jgi:hypothetical protein
MITKQLDGTAFAWDPSAFSGKGYWFLLSKKGGLGRAASKKEYSLLGHPDTKQEKKVELKQIEDDTGLAENTKYAKAKKVREKGFGDTIADKILGGQTGMQAIGGTISDKFKARVTGIKEKFDPLNIAKKLLGSGGTALLGSALGRKKEDIAYFSGRKTSNRDPFLAKYATTGIRDIASGDTTADVLSKLYSLVKYHFKEQTEEKEKATRDKERHDELLDALLEGSEAPTGKKVKLKREMKEIKGGKLKGSATQSASKEKKIPGGVEEKSPMAKFGSMAVKGIAGAGAAVTVAGLGGSSAKFESGGDAGRVSSGMKGGGKVDPGGVSYGTYQMSSVNKVPDKFVKNSKWAKDFQGMKSGTPEFSAKWKQIAADPKEGKEFAKAQHDYIKKSHFDPAADKAAAMGYAIQDPGVADAIWSLSVQHGGVQNVLNLSKKNMGGRVSSDPKTQIKSLYEARDKYTKGEFHKRYSQEVSYALAKAGTSPIPEEVSHEKGTKLAKSSGENKELKTAAAKSGGTTIINNNTTNIKQGDTKQTNTTVAVNDSPAFERAL